MMGFVSENGPDQRQKREKERGGGYDNRRAQISLTAIQTPSDARTICSIPYFGPKREVAATLLMYKGQKVRQEGEGVVQLTRTNPSVKLAAICRPPLRYTPIDVYSKFG